MLENEINPLKLIQTLNLDLGVLFWLSFEIILCGHEITYTINILIIIGREATVSRLRSRVYVLYCFIPNHSSHLHVNIQRLMLELAKYT